MPVQITFVRLPAALIFLYVGKIFTFDKVIEQTQLIDIIPIGYDNDIFLARQTRFLSQASKKCTFWLPKAGPASTLFFCWNFRRFPAIGLNRN